MSTWGRLYAAAFAALAIAVIAGASAGEAWQPIHEAANAGDVDGLRGLLDAGAPVDVPTVAGFTPLYLATQSDRDEAAALLLGRGADASAAHDGWTLLHVAAANDSVRVARALIAAGADPLSRAANGSSALRVGVLGGHAEVVQLLQSTGAAEDDLLEVAATRGHARVVRVLLGAPNHDAGKASAASVAAAANGQGDALELLLDAGVPLDPTLLHVAARNERPAIAELLLARGANLEARDADATTPLYVAAKDGSNKVARLLLERGADPNAANKDGATPLYISAFLGNAPLAKDLIAAGAEVDRRAIDASTTLHLAAKQGHVEVARVLLDHGASLDAQNFEGATPLDIATREGRTEMIAFLTGIAEDE